MEVTFPRLHRLPAAEPQLKFRLPVSQSRSILFTILYHPCRHAFQRLEFYKIRISQSLAGTSKKMLTYSQSFFKLNRLNLINLIFKDIEAHKEPGRDSSFNLFQIG